MPTEDAAAEDAAVVAATPADGLAAPGDGDPAVPPGINGEPTLGPDEAGFEADGTD